MFNFSIFSYWVDYYFFFLFVFVAFADIFYTCIFFFFFFSFSLPESVHFFQIYPMSISLSWSLEQSVCVCSVFPPSVLSMIWQKFVFKAANKMLFFKHVLSEVIAFESRWCIHECKWIDRTQLLLYYYLASTAQQAESHGLLFGMFFDVTIVAVVAKIG